MRRLFLLFFLSFFTTANAQHQLSDKAEISVLTIAPGAALNDAFGHNAFRIKDPKNSLDITYDYGRFDFDAPNFYLNFARGKLNYAIGSSDFYDLVKFYQWQNRSIKEQTLNLTPEQKQDLYAFLVENHKPENRNYLYDFFFDNCATKMKDVVNVVLNNNIIFKPAQDLKPKTFRTLIQDNLNKNSWGSLGIDVALGSVIDRHASPEEYMFLPENIYRFFENAKVKGQPLIKESHIVYNEKEEVSHSNFFMSPLFILSLLGSLILLITYRDYKNKRRAKWIDAIIFAITGLIGVFILLLWLATDHTATAQNYNLLWAFALNVFVIAQILKAIPKKWFIKYLKFLLILLVLMVFHWIVGVQVFAIGLMPLVIAIAIRYVFLLNYYKNLNTAN